ncbi:MAG: hypothetical protein JW950_12615 [Deltaproteobacteria bacterium]|nr:hypothetical protein [Deltaproteobacteria bacterium]
MIPFTVDVILLATLFILSFFYRNLPFERIALGFLLLGVLYVYIEVFSREVSPGPEGLLIKKFLRRKALLWEDITHVGLLIIGKKVYILLTTVKGFHILSNAYERYTSLLSELVRHLDREKVEQEVRMQIEHPIPYRSDIIGAWFAAVAISGIILLKLLAS